MNAPLKTIAHLLLNSWSAEYALRLTPADHLPETCLTWTFPQTYYTAMFSGRAVVILAGAEVVSEYKVAGEIKKLAIQSRLYGNPITCPNLFEKAEDFRISSRHQHPTIPAGVTLPDFHNQLVKLVSAIQLAHERYILRKIGVDAFAQIIAGMPSYLTNGFVVDRFATLTTVPV